MNFSKMIDKTIILSASDLNEHGYVKAFHDCSHATATLLEASQIFFIALPCWGGLGGEN